MGRALSLLLAGGLGGLLCWVIMEPFAPKSFVSDAWNTYEPRLAMVAGLLIGLFIGGISGRWQGSRTHAMIGAAVGGILGLIMGPIGIGLGSKIYRAIAGPGAGIVGVNLMTEFVGRSAGWAIFGAFIGVAEGAVGRNVSRAVQGLIGGLLGGGIGGAAFVLTGILTSAATVAAQQTNETGTIPRAVGLVCTGAGIGLLIGIVEAISRQAWVRWEVGRNEGKEWPVDAAQTYIGRDERAHIPLFGDPTLAPHHATILRDRGRYILRDAGTQLGVGLNGQRVTEAELTSGDMIQLGTIQLRFLLKSGQKRRVTAPEYRAAAVPVGGPAPVAAPAPTPSMPTQAFSAVAASPFGILATNGPLSGQRFPVSQPIEVGRESGAILLPFDANVSRRHASLNPSPGGLQVVDLGSTNGTLLNGTRVSQALAKIGDQIQIGQTVFQVV